MTFLCLILIQYVASQLIFLNSFATLQEQDMSQNVGRARSAFSDELSYLDTYVYDWAAWDDTYAFIRDANEDYIESNLVDETFIGSELNLMIFTDSSGEIVFSKAYDLENEEETSLPESLEQLPSDSVLLQHPDTDNSVAGILLLPKGPMLIVSRPIIKSNDEGPIHVR
jgi:sensor domain CHASE-containing protein